MGGGERRREREGLAGRQTEKGRQRDEVEREGVGRERTADGWRERRRQRHAQRQRETGRHADRQTDRRTDRQR